MKELHEGIIGGHYAIEITQKKIKMQGTNGPQCIDMSVIFADRAMHVNAVEGLLHRVWPN
jgi:hypothetical protein